MTPVHALLVGLHLVAAISWIGGMLFLSLVAAPSYRASGRSPEAAALFRSTARRFRVVVWTAAGILLVTGPQLVVDRGWPLFEPNRWPPVLVAKIFFVGLLFITVVLHDCLSELRTGSVFKVSSGRYAAVERILVGLSSWLPRLAIGLALGVVFIAALLARS